MRWATIDPGAPLDNTMGAMLIGVVLSAILHGVTIVQAYNYFLLYSKDVMHRKMLVALLVVMDAVHLALIAHLIYYHLITGYYDPMSLQKLIWSGMAQTICAGFNTNLVQSYYAYRIWRLSRNKMILSGIAIPIVGQNACGIAWMVLISRTKTYATLLKLSPLTTLNTALSTLIDIIIAISLIVLLRRARTGSEKSDNLISKIIVFFVTTGLLTSLCAIGSLIAVAVCERCLIDATFFFCLGRLYPISFIAALNARGAINQPAAEKTPYIQFTSVNHEVTGI